MVGHADARVALRVEGVVQAALDERDVLVAGLLLETERFVLVPEPDRAEHRDVANADVHVLDGDAATGKIVLGLELRATVDDGLERPKKGLLNRQRKES